MNRTLRALTLPLAAGFLLAACGSPEPDGAPVADGPTVAEPAPAASDGDESNVAPSDGGVPMDDGGDESDSWPIVEDEPMDGSQFEPVEIEGAFGFSESGGTFTLGAPEALPSDLASLLSDAGLSDEDIDKIQLIPVEIDNTEGFEADNLSGATAVTEDGVQHEFQQLGGYLYDIGEQYTEAGKHVAGDTVYDELWDRKDEAYSDVAPTAKSTQYLVVDDGTDLSGKFTYFELRSGDFGSPFPIFPKLG